MQQTGSLCADTAHRRGALSVVLAILFIPASLSGCGSAAPGDVLDGIPAGGGGGNTSNGGAGGDDATGGVVAGATDELAVQDLFLATYQTRSLRVALPAAFDDQAVDFEIVTPPAIGALDKLETGEDGVVTVTYTPPAAFVGNAQFSYRARAGERESNVGTVVISVYPEVFFDFAPREGQRGVEVVATAFTPSGQPLPEGSYTWHFGEQTRTDSAAAALRVPHVFGRGGRFEIGLRLSLPGLTTPIDCDFGRSDDRSRNESPPTVEIWPLISGHVLDASGAPVAGVLIRSETLPVAVATTAEGYYALAVPYGWSGRLSPFLGGTAFQPSGRDFANVTEDSPSNDYRAGGGDPANKPPTAQTQYVNVPEDGELLITLSATDPENDPLDFVISALPTKAALFDGADGHEILPAELPYVLRDRGRTIRYRPRTDERGVDVLRFLARDGKDSATVPILVVIDALNDPPRAIGASVAVTEDTPRIFELSAEDPDLEPLTYVVESVPQNGVLRDAADDTVITLAKLPFALPDGRNALKYSPSANYHGGDGLTFKVRDTAVTSAPATITLTVAAVNDAPNFVQSGPLALIVAPDSSASEAGNRLTLSATDPDAVGNSLTWSIGVPATRGTAAIVSGSPSAAGGGVVVSYAPGAGVTGSDSFRVQVSDGQGGSANMQVNVTIGTTSSANTYYVATADAGASDSNPGTLGAPFKTISRAAAVVAAGDTVIVKAGTYREQVTIKANGTATARITFQTFGDGPVIVDAETTRPHGVLIGASGGNQGNYVTVDGFAATGAVNSVGVAAGITVRSNKSVIVMNCHSYNNQTMGIRVVGTVENPLIEGCHVHHNAMGGIIVRNTSSEGAPTGVTIRWNHIHHNTGLAIEGADQIATTSATNTLIEYNLIHHAGDDCVDTVESVGTTVRYNILYLADWVNDPDGDGNGLKLGVAGGGGHFVHHNVSFLNANTGIQVNNDFNQAGTVVYHNTIYGNGTKGLTTTETSEARFLNNVTLGNVGADLKYRVGRTGYNDYNYVGANGEHFPADSPNSIVHPVDAKLNNLALLAIDSDGDKTPDAFEPFDDVTAFASARAAVEAAQLLVKDIFKLRTDSPCRDAGVVLPGYNDGYAGIKPDLGAFEAD